jgi:hypothetical protein
MMERYLFSNLAQCAITTTSFELYMSKTSVTKKEGAQSDQTPGKTPILHGAQTSEVLKLNRDLLIFSRPDFVQTSVCVHTQDLTQKQLASLKHSQL